MRVKITNVQDKTDLETCMSIYTRHGAKFQLDKDHHGCVLMFHNVRDGVVIAGEGRTTEYLEMFFDYDGNFIDSSSTNLV